MHDRPPGATVVGSPLESEPDPDVPAPAASRGGSRLGPAESPEPIQAPRPPLPLHDLRARIVGIPLFGIAIPQATGLFGNLRPTSPVYWLGVFYFVLLSFVVWQGNRFLLIKQRERFDWLDRPARKALILIASSVTYTAPVTIGMLVLWYRFARLSTVDWVVIRTVVIVVLTVVIFVTHVYETVYLIRQRMRDALRFEQLERARVEAELEALRNQVDPHFICNSLNALLHLIEVRSTRAQDFVERLADVYNYVLLNRHRELVTLRDELGFLDNYYRLVQLRYGEGLRLQVTADRARLDACRIVPISLQILLENAVKHNSVSPDTLLDVSVRLDDTVVSMENGLRPHIPPKPSSRLGLQNLDARCRLVVGRGIEVIETADRFTVRLPVVPRSPSPGAGRMSDSATARAGRPGTV